MNEDACKIFMEQKRRGFQSGIIIIVAKFQDYRDSRTLDLLFKIGYFIYMCLQKVYICQKIGDDHGGSYNRIWS